MIMIKCSYCDEDNETGYVVFDDVTGIRTEYDDDGNEWVDTCNGTGYMVLED